MSHRIEETILTHPWLVAEVDNTVLGYVYAHAFAARAAYAWSVETSVYLHPDAQGRGIGRALYDTLIPMLVDQGFHRAYAGIRVPNPASVALHERVGFRQVALYDQVGWKFGEWHDVGWWQRDLSPHHPT
jgi:phosphinothricin acetyltransferase